MMWQGIGMDCKGGWLNFYLEWPEVLLGSSGSSKSWISWYSWPWLSHVSSLLPLSCTLILCCQQERDLFFFLSHLCRLCRLLGNRSQGLCPLNQTPWTSSRANCAAWAIPRFCGYASLREWAKMTSSLHLLCTCLTKAVAFYPCHYLHFLLTLPYLIARELREKIQPEILELIKQQRLNRLCEGSSFRKIGNRRRQGKGTVSTVFCHVKNCSK